jgi:hypothetical protein
VGPSASLDMVTNRKIAIIAPAGNSIAEFSFVSHDLIWRGSVQMQWPFY